MTEDQKSALAGYVDLVRQRYGDRLVDVVIFGSRARGDNHEESDLDLAIILEDGDWDKRVERSWLAGETFWPLVNTGLHISPRVVSRSVWNDPALHTNPALIRNMHRDARRIEQAA